MERSASELLRGLPPQGWERWESINIRSKEGPLDLTELQPVDRSGGAWSVHQQAPMSGFLGTVLAL